MENNSNNITISLKGLIAIILVVAIIVAALMGYVMYTKIEAINKSNNNTENKSSTENSREDSNNVNTENQNNSSSNNTQNNNNNTNNNTNNSSSNITGQESSKSYPLSFNKWGIASKYSSGSYRDIPVSITNVTRGNQAARLVEEYCDRDYSIYKYEEAKDGMEWAVFDYKVDLSSIMTSSGVNLKVESKIIGTGETSSVKYNNKIYIITTTDMSSNDFVKESIAEGQIIAQLPIGCTDYLVVLGSNGGDNLAYFIGE